ncbi:Sensor histidine kinase ResE [bioreactor metagenome]|uniref:histidine kinase n=1 Tax=bioreactor metagenome TaxID=1076179 RepID=A0A645EMB7_9ZZZZ
MDAGFFTLNFTKCNVIEVIESITMSVVDYVNDKGINLIFDTDIEELVMHCDLDAIERIVLNLLSNAIKFTPVGGVIFVNVKLNEGKIIISVKDTGIGMTEETLSKVFERFKQGDELLTRRSEGSGIGLSLVKYLVEMHNGQVYVESKHKAGSEFFVELPINNGIKEEHVSNIDESYKIGDTVVQKISIEFSDIYL